MNTAGTELFTRAEALAGLPARRAQTALFLIESRTAHQVAQARQAREPFLGETTAAERDLAFVEAFTLGTKCAAATRPTPAICVCPAGRWCCRWTAAPAR